MAAESRTWPLVYVLFLASFINQRRAATFDHCECCRLAGETTILGPDQNRHKHHDLQPTRTGRAREGEIPRLFILIVFIFSGLYKTIALLFLHVNTGHALLLGFVYQYHVDSIYSRLYKSLGRSFWV